MPILGRRKLRLRAAEAKHKLGHQPVSYFSPALHYSTFISSSPSSFSFEHTCTHTHTRHTVRTHKHACRSDCHTPHSCLSLQRGREEEGDAIDSSTFNLPS